MAGWNKRRTKLPAVLTGSFNRQLTLPAVTISDLHTAPGGTSQYLRSLLMSALKRLASGASAPSLATMFSSSCKKILKVASRLNKPGCHIAVACNASHVTLWSHFQIQGAEEHFPDDYTRLSSTEGNLKCGSFSVLSWETRLFSAATFTVSVDILVTSKVLTMCKFTSDPCPRLTAGLSWRRIGLVCGQVVARNIYMNCHPVHDL